MASDDGGFVPRTPPTSVSALATWGRSTASLALTPPSSRSRGPFLHYADDVPPPPPYPPRSRRIPLEIHVRKARILIVAVAFVVVLLSLIATLRRGVVLATGDAALFRAERARRQREDELNFYAGTALALVASALEVAALLMAPIVVLVMLTDHAMLNDAFYWRLGLLLLQGLFIALLTNAFSTTYVTAGDPVVTRRVMTARDLVAPTLSVASQGRDLVGEKSVLTPRRAVSDTMLRTAVRPAYTPSARTGKCSSGQRSNQSVAARFGFHTSEALLPLATNGLALDASLNASVGDWLLRNATPSPRSLALPHNLTTAANLAIHALHFLVDRLRLPLWSASTTDPIQVYADEATHATTENDTAALLHATAAMLNSSLAPLDAFGFFFAPVNAEIQFARHERGAVRIDTLTLTLPFRRGIMQRPLSATQFGTLRDDSSFDPAKDGAFVDVSSGDAVFQVFPQEECGTRGCWLRKPESSSEADAVWTMRPEVVAYSRCLATFGAIGASELEFTACPEDKIVNHSVVVGAIGSTLLADRFVEYEGDGFEATSGRIRRVNVTNLRRTMSVTVAFVSWRVATLTELYDNTACSVDSETRCVGLWYPATDVSDVLVDSHHLIADELSTIAGDVLAGQPLVSLVSDLPGGAFLAFNNVQHGIEQVASDGTVSQIDPTAPETRWPCARDLELVTDAIVFNRWYIDHSLQEAYTAALFHVFQFGVEHGIAYEPDSQGGTVLVKQIDLFGNVAVVAFSASIPEMAALVSTLSGVLFLVSVVVVVCIGKRRECAIRELTDVHRVARVHLVEQFFPKVFLKCTVFTTPQGQPLEPFRIVAMRLHHETPDGDIFLTFPAPALDSSIDSVGLSDVLQAPGRAFAIPTSQFDGDGDFSFESELR